MFCDAVGPWRDVRDPLDTRRYRVRCLLSAKAFERVRVGEPFDELVGLVVEVIRAVHFRERWRRSGALGSWPG
jgi:hypothetical protein